MNSGVKYDEGKLPIHSAVLLNFPHAMDALAAVTVTGQDKYPTFDNWKRVDGGVDKYLNAALRHLVARAKGEVLANDTGHDHYRHALWNLCAVVQLVEEQKESKERDTKYDWLVQIYRETAEGPTQACQCGKTAQPRSQGPSLTALPTEDSTKRAEEVWR